MGWWACGPGFYWGNGINSGYGWMGLIGMAIQLIFWIALILLGVYLFRHFVRPGGSSSSFVRNDTSLDILRERYARGEVDLEEYQKRKEELLR